MDKMDEFHEDLFQLLCQYKLETIYKNPLPASILADMMVRYMDDLHSTYLLFKKIKKDEKIKD